VSKPVTFKQMQKHRRGTCVCYLKPVADCPASKLSPEEQVYLDGPGKTVIHKPFQLGRFQ
jgi:hypothetical protein